MGAPCPPAPASTGPHVARWLFGSQRADVLTGCGHDRFDDVMVAGAAADIAVQIVPDLCLGRLGVVFQQRRGRHDHARCTKTALQPVVVLKRL
eukprot:CAMPEP_0184456544 /NCGR_PEP_ID=MMETSP0740-20130409/27161_1 /TAXON_ID=385413 /ORGANISM="Thalassiosira miniscula, Strain CCMP1093" /LENGTH=92 /DNA_ID=CAMNT_0026828709 /DNA_START=20 /DNA_END=295 /DNA_ORIENTATION=+